MTTKSKAQLLAEAEAQAKAQAAIIENTQAANAGLYVALAKLGSALHIAADALHDLANSVDQAGDTLQAVPLDLTDARAQGPVANKQQRPQ